MAPPPAEQLLVREYLSRLSVAARGQLSAAERRALLKSTQDFIEQQTSLSGRPHPMDVAKLLSRLGDPSGLVRMERQRLAALRGEDFEESEQQGWGMVARVLRREGGRALGLTLHRPAQEDAGLRLTLLEAGRAADAEADEAPDGRTDLAEAFVAEAFVAEGTVAAGTFAEGTVAEGTVAEAPVPEAPVAEAPVAGAARAGTTAAGTRPARWPQRPSLVPLRYDDQDEDAGHHGAPGSAGSMPIRTGSVMSSPVMPGGSADYGNDYEAADDDTPAYGMAAVDEADEAGGGWLLNQIAGPVDLLEPVDPVGRTEAARAFDRVARQTADFISGMPARWRRHPIEVTALLLLGPAGFLFPPLWLFGALLAMASKLWHPLDKWAGLATPIVLTVVGFVLGFIHGGTIHIGHDVHEGWALAVIVSRFSALLSAAYLAWQARRGRRPAPIPPWKRS